MELYVDLMADLKIASIYGAFAVSSWIQRSQLALYSVTECISAEIVPLAEEGILLPVSETCCAFHLLLESAWLNSIRREMTAQERNPGTLSPILLRLGALGHGLQNAGGMDTRSAATLFDEVSQLEERAVRSEVDIPDDLTFQKPEIRDLAKAVLVTLMKKELARNEALVKTWALADIPSLVEKRTQIARSYTPDRRFLLATSQREALVPGLFVSFLTVQLLDCGWLPFKPEVGVVMLMHGEKTIQPAQVIDDLITGKLDSDEFFRLIT
jgi:hypothetical protein